MILWRIYYGDGSTFSSEDGSWEQAPSDDVQVVVVGDPSEVWGRFLEQGYDYYVCVKEEPPYCTNDLNPFLRKTGLVKFGRQIPKDRWNELMSRADADPDFPKTSPRRRSTDRKK